MTSNTPHVAVVLPFKERYSPGLAGAIALNVDQLARFSGWRTSVLGMGDEAPLPGGTFVPVRPRYVTTKISQALVTGWEAVFYFEGLRRRLRSLSPDVIRVHNRPLMAAMLQRAFPGVPVILVLDNDPCSMKEINTPRRARVLHELAGVVPISKWIGQRLFEVAPDLDRAKTAIIYNVIECAAIHEVGHDTDALMAGKEDLALFVGRINGAKGALPFVEAVTPLLASHPGWTAVAIGAFHMGSRSLDNPSDYQKRFLAAVGKAGPQLRFLGPRPYDETMAWMRRARILAIPSRHKEAFARVAVEGMFNGAALIACTRGGALPEIAPLESGALHIADESAAAIGPALAQLMADPADCRRRGARGHRYALANYHPEKVGAAIDAFQARCRERT